jgi:large subunit ribosomal protein L29
MKAKDIRVLSDQEIDSKIKEEREKLFKQKMQKALGQQDNLHKISQTKREVARLLTVKYEKRSKNG